MVSPTDSYTIQQQDIVPTIRFIRSFLGNNWGMGNRRICKISLSRQRYNCEQSGSNRGEYAVRTGRYVLTI